VKNRLEFQLTRQPAITLGIAVHSLYTLLTTTTTTTTTTTGGGGGGGGGVGGGSSSSSKVKAD